MTQAWVPEQVLCVLGRGNRPEKELYPEVCRDDGVPVLKRYGGGGTVVLHPGCLIVSIGCWLAHPYRNDRYFQMFNQAVIDGLSALSNPMAELQQRGHSDLCWGDKKVAGTSLFRSRGYALYQASILVDARLDLIERYLPMPSRTPEYRQGRSHRDFVTDLQAIDPGCQSQTLSSRLPDLIQQNLKGSQELTAPQSEHVPWLLKRVASAD